MGDGTRSDPISNRGFSPVARFYENHSLSCFQRLLVIFLPNKSRKKRFVMNSDLLIHRAEAAIRYLFSTAIIRIVPNSPAGMGLTLSMSWAWKRSPYRKFNSR